MIDFTIFFMGFSLVIVYFFVLQRFFTLLRGFESSIWRDLGEPHVIKNNLDGFETGVVNDFSDIPIEDGRVKDVMGFVSLFSFAKSLVIFAHDGHPVFICDLT